MRRTSAPLSRIYPLKSASIAGISTRVRGLYYRRKIERWKVEMALYISENSQGPLVDDHIDFIT